MEAIPASMQAVVQTAYTTDAKSGTTTDHFPAILEKRTVPVVMPDAAKKEVLVRVSCASVNPADVHLARGVVRMFVKLPLPIVLGRDFSGVVAFVPDGVTGVSVGDRVCGYNDPDTKRCHGAMAEYVCCPVPALAAIPASVSMADAAALPLVGRTAAAALLNAGIDMNALLGPSPHSPIMTNRPLDGRSFLVLGGSSGIGLCTMAVLRALGSRRICCTSTNDALCRSFGATEVIDYRSPPFWPARKALANAFDTVFDNVEGYNGWSNCGAVLRRGGIYSAVVLDQPRMDAPIGVKFVLGSIFSTINRAFWGAFPSNPKYRVVSSVPNEGPSLAHLLHLRATNTLPSLLDTSVNPPKDATMPPSTTLSPPAQFRFSAEDAAEMLRRQHTGHTKGKLVMQID